MKKILKYSLLAVLALSALTGCKKALETDQFKGFSLAAIAPNPVMRGAQLRIVGNGLENVSEVQFAGNVSVTDIEVVTKGERSEIRVTVPMEGPIVGPVTVVTKDGLKASTRFDLEYTEPIEQSSFSPATALSGDVITITGEYLQNVKCVIFGGDVKVNEFVSQSRHELKVTVPRNAVTGPVIVSDVDEVNDLTTIPNQIYSASELIIGQPTVVKAEKAVYKSGDLVKISGEHLDMIANVALPQVDEVEFELTDNNTITFALPAKATDGEITLTSFAGDTFIAGEIETVTVSDLAVKSLAEDERFKAGCTVEISGEDLDLVTKVEFNGAEASYYLSDGKILATQPAAAKDGVITVTLESGKQAFTEEIEVVKPVILGWMSEGVAGAFKNTIVGHDLDLVTSAKIGTAEQGLIDCEFSFDVDEGGNPSVVVDVPRMAYTAPITLTADSGYEDATDVIYITYDEAVSISFDAESYGLGRPISISGTNLMKIESIYIKGNKVPGYSVRTDEAMTFEMPEGLGPGVYRLDITLVDGTELTWPVPFAITAPYTETFIFEGSEDLGSWSNQPYFGADGAFAELGLAIGDQIRIYYTPTADWWQFQIFGGHWEGMTFPELGGGNTVNADNAQADATFFTFEVTADNIGTLTSVGGWGGALLCQGENVIITGVSMIHFGAAETVVWEGTSTHTGDYAVNLELGGEDDWVNAELWEGAEVRIYFTPDDPADWSIQIFDGHWGGMSYVTPNGVQWNAENSPEAIEKGYVSFKAEGAAFAAMTSHQWWGFALILQGKNLVVTKLAYI